MLYKEERDIKKAMKASLIEARKQAKVKKIELNKLSQAQSNCDTNLNCSKPKGLEDKMKVDVVGKDISNSKLNLIKCDTIKPRIQAQRKFASITALNVNSYSSMKCQIDDVSSIKEVFTHYQPTTEDFLTFLCLKDTSYLPLHLDFFALNGITKRETLLANLKKSQEDYLVYHQSQTKSILNVFDNLHKFLNNKTFKGKKGETKSEKRVKTSYKLDKQSSDIKKVIVNGNGLVNNIVKDGFKALNRNQKKTKADTCDNTSRQKMRRQMERLQSSFGEDNFVVNVIKHQAKVKIVKSSRHHKVERRKINNSSQLLSKKVNQQALRSSNKQNSSHHLLKNDSFTNQTKVKIAKPNERADNLVKCAMNLRPKNRKVNIIDKIKNTQNESSQLKVYSESKKNKTSSKNLIKVKPVNSGSRSKAGPKVNLRKRSEPDLSKVSNVKTVSSGQAKKRYSQSEVNVNEARAKAKVKNEGKTHSNNRKPAVNLLEKMITRSATNNLKIRKIFNL